MTMRPGKETIVSLLIPRGPLVWSEVALIFLPARREAGVGTLSNADRLPGFHRAGPSTPS